MHLVKVSYHNDDGEEVECKFPAKMEVCPECEGHGYVLSEGLRGVAYTSEEFMQEFDEEGREQYFRRGGIYDVICPECLGKNVVPAIDEEQVATNAELNQHYQNYCRSLESLAEMRRIEAAERRMGA